MLLLRFIIVKTMGILFCCLIIIQIVCSSSAADERYQGNSSMFSIINEKSNGILEDIWRSEPSRICNSPKPPEKSLEDEEFLRFRFNEYLCVILYDASLRYLELTSESMLLNIHEDSANKIIESYPHNNSFCQKMKENQWSTNIEENKRWLQEFNTLMKNTSLCNTNCGVDVLNSLCAYVLWLDSSIKGENHNQPKVKHNGVLSLIGQKQLNKLHKQPYELPKKPTKEKDLKMPPVVQEEQNVSNNPKNQRKPISIQKPETRLFNQLKIPFSVKTFDQPNPINVDHLDKNENGNDQKPPGPKKTNLVHSLQTPVKESKEDNTQGHSQILPIPILSEQHNNGLMYGPKLPNPAPNGGQHNADIGKETGPEVSTPDIRPSTIDSNVVTSGQSFDEGKGLALLDSVENKLKNSGNTQQDMDKLSPFSNPHDIKQMDPSHEGKVENTPQQGDVKAVEIPLKDKPTSPTSDRGKIDMNLHKNEGSVLPQENKPPEANLDLEEANHAGEGLSKGAPGVEPDNHEQQREMEENLGSRDEDVMDHPEEQSPEMVEGTDEPRFHEDGDEPIIKPNTSPKIVDYAVGLPDEDDAPINAEQDTVAQNDADAGYVHDRFVDAEDSHFFAYFMTMIILCIIGYLIFHNKQKILALALEGRVRKGNRRRPSTSGYRKLDSNLEEAVTSNCSGTSVTHVIY